MAQRGAHLALLSTSAVYLTQATKSRIVCGTVKVENTGRAVQWPKQASIHATRSPPGWVDVAQGGCAGWHSAARAAVAWATSLTTPDRAHAPADSRCSLAIRVTTRPKILSHAHLQQYSQFAKWKVGSSMLDHVLGSGTMAESSRNGLIPALTGPCGSQTGAHLGAVFQRSAAARGQLDDRPRAQPQEVDAASRARRAWPGDHAVRAQPRELQHLHGKAKLTMLSGL